MNREFLHLYNRELGLFYEHAREFAEEYPGIAQRLGSMVQDTPDPMIAALMESAAFLATRVQLKLKHEFATFTDGLLEQLVPNFLAPVPSIALVQITPDMSDAALRDGVRIERGSNLDAKYRVRDRSVACQYTTTSEVVLSPLTITRAEYLGSIAPIEELGLEVTRDALSGLRMTFRVRSAKTLEAEPPVELAAKDEKTWAKGLKLPYLRVNLVAPDEGDGILLYEEIFGHTMQIALRWRTADLKWHIRQLPIEDVLQPIGFDPDEALYPIDHRVFRGFNFVRDYFVFPRTFMGFRLADFGHYLKDIEAAEFDLIFVFDDYKNQLVKSTRERNFKLFATPAINLFERSCSRVLLKSNDFEYQVIPENTRPLEYEPHRITKVRGIRPGSKDARTVHPIYASPDDGSSVKNALFYAIRRMQRRRTSHENARLKEEMAAGQRERDDFDMGGIYMGTDVFITLVGNDNDNGAGNPVRELSIEALCSNRHLTADLPWEEGEGADFILTKHGQYKVAALMKPTDPREPVLSGMRFDGKPSYTGENAWRLINMLALNHLGLSRNRAGRNAAALRDVLSLFADLNEKDTDRQIRAISKVDVVPDTRRVRVMNGVATARGLKITVTLDDRVFTGSSFLLGKVLENYFAEYVSLNQFTQTVIDSLDRGKILVGQPRIGRRQAL